MTGVFRKQYRPLTTGEQSQIESIKTSAEVLYNQLYLVASNEIDPSAARAMALAKTKLEECVMWATKAITG